MLYIHTYIHTVHTLLQGHGDVVEHLVKSGASTDAVTPEGERAHDLARKYKYASVERMLSPK